MTDEQKALRLYIASIYERSEHAIKVSPSWLATEAMAKLDPDKISPHLVYLGCHLQLRQIARSICRAKFEPDDEEAEQHALFPDLQKRYPIVRQSRDDEPEYILLEHMSKDDVLFNVARLRKEASAKLVHADALEAWWQQSGELAS